jgi:hypothetical protein
MSTAYNHSEGGSKKMAMKKARMKKKVLCCFVILAILMSTMPIPIFAIANNITSARVTDEASLGPSELSNSTAVGAEIEQLASSLDYEK